MSRSLRLYGKKRGERRTGSRQLGNVGMVLFFAVFLVGGCAMLAFMMYSLAIPEWRVTRGFVESTCAVRDKRLYTSHGKDSLLYRPEIQIEYLVDGREYRTWTYDITKVSSSDQAANQAILDQFELGGQYPCWYDPRRPEEAVLVAGFSWFTGLMLLLPAVFLIIGGGGLIYTLVNLGKSTERLAAMAQSAARRDLFHEAVNGAAEFPFVPHDADQTNSPGTYLKFRLPTAATGWSLVVLSVASVLFCSATAAFATILWQGWGQGEAEWPLLIFMVPFGIVGLVSVVFLIRQGLVAAGVGPTIVEISEHPLFPGGQFQVFVSQAGRLTMKSLRVCLVCEEEATFRQGTNTRTATCRVHEAEIFRRESFDIQQGAPLEIRCPVEVPARAMHSFQSPRNRIKWKFVVVGAVDGWPDYERSFPVHVYPRIPGNRRL